MPPIPDDLSTFNRAMIRARLRALDRQQRGAERGRGAAGGQSGQPE